MELIEKLCALVPHPNSHAIRYHGIIAPHAKAIKLVVKEPAPIEAEPLVTQTETEKPLAPRKKKLRWAQLLARVFNLDLTHCPQCGGNLRIIAAIVDSHVIEKILTHLGLPTEPPVIAKARPPPQMEFDSYC